MGKKWNLIYAISVGSVVAIVNEIARKKREQQDKEFNESMKKQLDSMFNF